MRGPNNIDWNNEIWDALRLVTEFVSLKAWDYRGKTMEELVWSDQILFQRLIAVIHAYIGDPFHRTGIPFSYTSAVFSQSGYRLLLQQHDTGDQVFPQLFVPRARRLA